jgi:flagellar assembly factor FliW
MRAADTALPSAVCFTAPPPGLEPAVNFRLAPIAGAPGLYSLAAIDGTARLFVLDAARHLPDYSPQPPGPELERLGTAAPTVLVVVNPGEHSTVNLAAPILLNTGTGACMQLILESRDWPLRAPLSPAREQSGTASSGSRSG